MGRLKTYKNAYKLSQEVHNNYVNSYPVDIFNVINQFDNIKLVKSSAKKELNFIEDGYSFKRNNNYMIIYNDNKPPNRIKFTIAHELGHILLEHLEQKLECNTNRQTDKIKDLFEKEADTFASNLLAPPHLIEYAKANIDDFEYSSSYIANLFCISEACAKVRLADYDEWFNG